MKINMFTFANVEVDTCIEDNSKTLFTAFNKSFLVLEGERSFT